MSSAVGASDDALHKVSLAAAAAAAAAEVAAAEGLGLGGRACRRIVSAELASAGPGSRAGAASEELPGPVTAAGVPAAQGERGRSPAKQRPVGVLGALNMALSRHSSGRGASPSPRGPQPAEPQTPGSNLGSALSESGEDLAWCVC